MPYWLIVLSWVSVLLGLATAAVIAASVKLHPQRMPIMNVVWPVTGVYFPLFGRWLYRLIGRPMTVDAPRMGSERPH
ncbi:MAG: DUF4396 domain-containing protein, partial [Steroidobacteraceae bacterium]